MHAVLSKTKLNYVAFLSRPPVRRAVYGLPVYVVLKKTHIIPGTSISRNKTNFLKFVNKNAEIENLFLEKVIRNYDLL